MEKNICTETIVFTVFKIVVQNGPPDPLRPQARCFPGSLTNVWKSVTKRQLAIVGFPGLVWFWLWTSATPPVLFKLRDVYCFALLFVA